MERNEQMAVDALQHCRHYKGEDSPVTGEFWHIERAWLQAMEKEDTEMLLEWLDGLRIHNLLKWNKEDGVPVSLKGILLNRYLHHVQCASENDMIKEFKRYYEEYIKSH